MIRIVNWNVGRRRAPLQELVKMDADVALLQEVGIGGWKWLAAAGNGVAVTPYEPWLPWPPGTYDRWPLVAQLSHRVRLEWFEYCFPIHWPSPQRFEVSGIGTIAVARVVPVADEEPFFAVSMYARWRPPHPIVGDANHIHADAAAHRINSDLSQFTSPRKGSSHRIVAAGDLNMGFVGSFENAPRSHSVLTRMNALGLDYLGPITAGGDIVPTLRTGKQGPAAATTQLDHVFASRGLRERLRVRAMNGADEWESSDHCRIVIEIRES